MNSFKIASLSFDAFSGRTPYINKKVAACIPDLGPIPPGTYYILDRESGGRLGALWDLVEGKKDWFSLYAADDWVDDFTTYCEEVKRGNFRLHPKGTRGLSRACVVIDKEREFQHLRSLLQSTKPFPIPDSQLVAYGRLTVK